MSLMYILAGGVVLLMLAALVSFLGSAIHMWIVPSQRDKPRLGLLDVLDIGIGRLSDSDTTNGQRVRSFGQTVMFWMMLPLVLLVLSHAVGIVIIASSTNPTISLSSVILYGRCLKRAKTPKDRALCKRPSPSKGVKASAKLLDGGMWPWIGAIVLAAMGFAFALIRRTQDFNRAKELGAMYVAATSNGKKVPDFLMTAWSASVTKLSGSAGTTTSSDAVSAAETADSQAQTKQNTEKPADEKDVQSGGGGGKIDLA